MAESLSAAESPPGRSPPSNHPVAVQDRARGAGRSVSVGIGVDIIEIARIERAMARFGSAFTHRIYTEGEIALCRRAERRAPERFAVRFAAKEAVMKALGTGWTRGVRWVDIEIPSNPEGKPTVRLHGKTARIAARLGVRTVHIALSHSRDYAVATALALSG